MSLRSSARNPLTEGGIDPQVVDEAIYGGSLETLDTGRVVARPTPIAQIWADARQPRRAIPISIRLHWNGNPDDVPALLAQWHRVATAAAARDLNIIDILTGAGDGVETDNTPSLFRDYVELLRLAQSIHAEGLINPVTLVNSDGHLLIESGERRWLAYHLLAIYIAPEQYQKIAAATSDGRDFVWRQASENTARRSLNAISMARQLALLIMAAREANGENYRAFDEIVQNGVCDRRYYAQVADGSSHSVPRGMGERIQGAMGLGKDQLSQYRKLLRLTDDELVNDILWMQADLENWPEGWLREAGRLTPVSLREVVQRENWTIDDLRALQQKAQPAVQIMDVPPAFTRGQRVWTANGVEATVQAVNGQLVKVLTRMGAQEHYANRLSATPPQSAPSSLPPPTSMPSTRPGQTPSPFTTVAKVGGDKSVQPSPFDQHIGEMVLVVETEEMGVLGRRRPDGRWSVRIGSQYRIFDEMELVTTGVSADDYVPPAAPPADAELPDSEPVTDNTDSLTPIVAVNSDDYWLLHYLWTTASKAGEMEAAEALDKMKNVTPAEATMWAEAGELNPTLDTIFERVQLMMANLLSIRLSGILAQIHDTVSMGQ